MATSRTTKVLGVNGTKLTLDGKPFCWQGLAFFNALYNPNFNKSDEDRMQWLRKFKANGISVLRIWCQWSIPQPRNHVDLGPESTLFAFDGAVREQPFQRLATLLKQMDSLDMVLEPSLFCQEMWPYFLPIPAAERAAREITERLKPYGNLLLQVWSECSIEWKRYYEIVKKTDPGRVATTNPGISMDRSKPFDHLGDSELNNTIDVLTPHTMRTEAYPFWYLAPAQMEYLLDTYKKPVIDDSPARHGPTLYGGVQGGTQPEQHIEHIKRDRALGGYHNYLHDMFQYGYGHELTPPSGIPDPDFSPFHRQVFNWLRDHPTW
jgi:hypothetical protein